MATEDASKFYQVLIRGKTPILTHNGFAGLDIRSPEKVEIAEIAKKRGTNRTEADDIRLRELETKVSLWLNENNEPTIPDRAVRACIERAARSLKEGKMVREGLIIESVDSFSYDTEKYGTTVEEISKSAQFLAPVVVGQSRLIRTRAKFDTPWELTFIVQLDIALCDAKHLEKWLRIAGQRVGLGDWRPEKSGTYGRFELVSVDEVEFTEE